MFICTFCTKLETRPLQKFWKSSELWGTPRKGFRETVICHLLLYPINSHQLSGGRQSSLDLPVLDTGLTKLRGIWQLQFIFLWNEL